MSDAEKPPLRKRLKPEERRQQLLICAIEAFAMSGVERAGHGDVAKIANISTATVFNYFPTREDLTKAVFTHIRDTIREVFLAVPDIELSKADSIIYMANAYRDLTKANPNLVKAYMNWSETFSPKTRSYYLSLKQYTLAEIASRFPPGENNMTDARIGMATANIMAHMILDGENETLVTALINRVADALS